MRRKDCDLLCSRISANPTRCSNCQEFRCTLKRSVSRLNQSLRIASGSRTNYKSLDPQEKNRGGTRGRIYFSPPGGVFWCHRYNIARFTQDVCSRLFPVHATAVQCVEMYNVLKEKRMARPLCCAWVRHDRFAFGKNTVWLHPLGQTTHRCSVWVCGAPEIPTERPHTLLWVWMSMEIEYGDFKNELVFNKHTGSLTGFVDLGSANEDIERWFSNTYGQETRHSSSWLDHYFSASLSGTDMYTHTRIFIDTLLVHIVPSFFPQLKRSSQWPGRWLKLLNYMMYLWQAMEHNRFYRLCQPKGLPYKTDTDKEVSCTSFAMSSATPRAGCVHNLIYIFVDLIFV